MTAGSLARPLVVLVAVACACGDTKSDASRADAGTDAGPAPPLDPGLFDCTSLSRAPLDRRASTTPECLRDPNCKSRLVSAHRGAGGQLGRIAPEDSLAAYRAGIAMGVDLVETDPRPTSDGALVNVHDATLDRTTSGTGDVDKHTLAEIKALTLRVDGLSGDFACERVPTLEELLATCKGRALVLVDGNKTDRVDLLVAAIQKTDTLDWAVFDTSSTQKIDQALALEPRLMIQPRVASATEAQTVLDHYKTHVPVFVEIEASAFPSGADVVHTGGTRVLVDAFGIDASVRFGGAGAQYLDFYSKGADVVQSDLPDIVLGAIGREVPPR